MAGGKMLKTGSWGLLLCAVGATSACNKDSASAPAPAAPVNPTVAAAQKRGPTAAERTAGMVEATAQGKSLAAVDLKFDLTQRPKVGQPLSIGLAMVPQVAASPATIRVNSGDGVAVADGANQFDIPATEAGEVYRQTVNVTPTEEGVVLVGVTVSLKHDEVTDVKNFFIPIIADK